MPGKPTGEQCYYNGVKDLYTISGETGEFVKVGNPRGFYVSYKSATKTEELAPNPLNRHQQVYKYTAAGDAIWELEITLERWTDLGGATGSAKGENILMFPGAKYPHLTINYTENGGQYTLGEAHYSTSADDGARLSYKRTSTGWKYVNPTFTTSPTTKQKADAAVATVEGFLKHPG